MMFRCIQIVLIACVISGCGFHLAGEAEFDEELYNTHIQSTTSSEEMLRLLERNLRSNNINIVVSKSATAVLRIINEETERVVLTVDNDGKAREFELHLRIKFDVIRPDKSIILQQQTIALNRDFVFDIDNLLGANEEEQQLFSEMRRDVVKLIVYRLQTI